MSTKENFVLTDGEKFYDQEKNMVGLGAGKLKVYTNENGAKSAARMIAKGNGDLPPLVSISLENAKKADDDARNGKATEATPLPTSDDALREKEAREFEAMLENTYGHITPDSKLQEKIHLFTLSPVGKRVSFNADYIRALLGDYDEATKSTPVPANKQALLTQIGSQQAKMSKYRSTFGDDPETLDDLLVGLKAKIAPLQAQLAELPDENKTIFDALFLLPLCSKLFSEKALKPSTRGQNGNGQAWAMGEGQFLAFDYSSTRICQNGLDLSKLGLASIQAFIYHPDHENVKDLNIPAKKLAVVSADHILVATIDAKQALGNILGEAIFEIVKPAIGRAKFIQAISSTGVDAFQSTKSAVLSKTAKTVSAEVIRNGQHSELEQAGQNADTKKDPPAIE